MEVESPLSQEPVEPDNTQFDNSPYISPDVAAAMSGEVVDFSMDLGIAEDVEVDEDAEVVETRPGADIY